MYGLIDKVLTRTYEFNFSRIVYRLRSRASPICPQTWRTYGNDARKGRIIGAETFDKKRNVTPTGGETKIYVFRRPHPPPRRLGNRRSYDYIHKYHGGVEGEVYGNIKEPFVTRAHSYIGTRARCVRNRKRFYRR